MELRMELTLEEKESEYENERRKKIERNQQLLQSLGLTQPIVIQTPKLDAASRKAHARKVYVKTRHSARLEGIKLEVWNASEYEDISIEGSPKHTAKKRRVSGEHVVKKRAGRVYDNINGLTCHQCRQKTIDEKTECCVHENVKPVGVHHYCRICLLNRYGEHLEEVKLLDNWACPYCRGVCNCSFCRKKKGKTPTGILTQRVRKQGFASVSDFLLNEKKEIPINPESYENVNIKKRKRRKVSVLEEATTKRQKLDTDNNSTDQQEKKGESKNEQVEEISPLQPELHLIGVEQVEKISPQPEQHLIGVEQVEPQEIKVVNLPENGIEEKDGNKSPPKQKKRGRPRKRRPRTNTVNGTKKKDEESQIVQSSEYTDQWLVENILEKRINKNTEEVEYLIKWAGYGPEFNEWVRKVDCGCTVLIKRFENNLKKKSKTTRRTI